MKLYVVYATNEYNDTWAEKIYSNIDTAKEYLIANLQYWKEDDQNVTEDINMIKELSDNDLLDSEFYVDLPRRGIELRLGLAEIDSAVDII